LSDLEPWVELFPRPSVHSDLAALVTLCCVRNYVATGGDSQRSVGIALVG
jgi:hypothetical protein